MGDRQMKIYFCGSIRGGRKDGELYARIIKQLEAYGKVLTEHVGHKDCFTFPTGAKTDLEIYDQDMAWLEDSDAVVAEVTQVSMGVGFELGRAVAWNKRVLCLYRPGDDSRLSAMVRGAHDGKNFLVKDYKEEDVPELLKEFFGH
ncbi:putative 2'-deoxynucleoside 5'-phosphate N-hydrolase 1 isoform X1 [Strongylocentrotus purpuratus]|uniref:Putative 2'-deoxynucleoside 5'-phosphate N-hydrolase 1 n=1 Tax=Strongylocentrotus purpuratus TaxID=7668 RepID=A0A7M7PSG3_STRPU|nr:putative 2'-deoxynucleoside 5'-phosphate N-hydrolase 1 isoform X1 [Strongylocentrotus purpuratus]